MNESINRSGYYGVSKEQVGVRHTFTSSHFQMLFYGLFIIATNAVDSRTQNTLLFWVLFLLLSCIPASIIITPRPTTTEQVFIVWKEHSVILLFILLRLQQHID